VSGVLILFLCLSLSFYVSLSFPLSPTSFFPHTRTLSGIGKIVCVCVCVCVCVSTYACVCVCVCQREKVFILTCRQNRCFGHADTAFPERPIFGPIRSMTPSGKWMSMCMHVWVCMCV